jgi:hypothetical protein
MAANSVGGFICTSVALSSPTLDLSRTGLAELPQELYNARHVECLYLEGNKLTSIPDDFFQHLPNLQWLDLRNNRLTQLPSSIGTLRLNCLSPSVYVLHACLSLYLSFSLYSIHSLCYSFQAYEGSSIRRQPYLFITT